MTYWQGGIEHQDYCQVIDGRPCTCGASERGLIGEGANELIVEPYGNHWVIRQPDGALLGSILGDTPHLFHDEATAIATAKWHNDSERNIIGEQRRMT